MILNNGSLADQNFYSVNSIFFLFALFYNIVVKSAEARPDNYIKINIFIFWRGRRLLSILWAKGHVLSCVVFGNILAISTKHFDL